MRRRSWLGAAASATLAACTRAEAPRIDARWVGVSHERGHRLREPIGPASAGDAVPRRAGVLIVGAGIAGLAAARALERRGVDDVHLLELEDAPGGNGRGHAIGALPCPLGAHYLPLPGPQDPELSQWLHEIGLLRQAFGRTVPDERHLCHSPQERLFIDGGWHEGLLPPAAVGSSTWAQYQRFEASLRSVQREAAFAMPTHRAP